VSIEKERAARKQPFVMPGGIYLMTLKLNIVEYTCSGVTKFVPLIDQQE
jgi:hypothetical protein